MNNQEQPFSTGASFPAVQQPPPWHPTYKQDVGSSAPQVFYHSAPGVQPQVLYHEQPTATFAQPYVAPVQPPVTPMRAPTPNEYPPPNSFLILSIITLAICGFLNLTSIIFGFPALFLSIQSEDSKRQLQYSSAKSKGNMALVLTFINIFYNFAIICVMIGVLTSVLHYRPCYCGPRTEPWMEGSGQGIVG